MEKALLKRCFALAKLELFYYSGNEINKCKNP